MKTLYFDCFAGASGDMILGALVALGVEREELLRQLSLLNFSGYEVSFETVDRSGLSATKAFVKIPHEHQHRHLSHIVKIINESGLNDSVKKRAIEIFTTLGHAEAKMHNVPVEKVHFHEVGAMDAIIDIVGACIGFELLGVEEFYASKMHVGSGMVKMAHGTFPVPPPAVAEMLKDAPIYSTDITGELVTPTGAAIISTLVKEYGKIPEMTVKSVGYGAGTREYKDFPNVLRLILGNIETQRRRDAEKKIEVSQLSLLETNIDNLSPEVLGFVMERAFEAGALDCWFEAIQMKKNRPAVKIAILCEPSERDKFMQLLFAETTTLGVRVSEIERHCLPREFAKVSTEYGEIDVKFARLDDKTVKFAPEYEQLRTAAVENNVPLREVEAAARKAFEEQQK
jgi:pyridinium-3,5-bisthiocarboxylic acid mononucleotide nickel chelatase